MREEALDVGKLLFSHPASDAKRQTTAEAKFSAQTPANIIK